MSSSVFFPQVFQMLLGTTSIIVGWVGWWVCVKLRRHPVCVCGGGGGRGRGS